MIGNQRGTRLLAGLSFGLACLVGASGGRAAEDETVYANRYDIERAKVLAARTADWRNGAIVYQVFVDRFAPSANLEAKRSLYAPPRRLRSWSEQPEPGEFLDEAGVWSHELDFWGGDLPSLIGRLDYIADLGADVLYLNPIHNAKTNHKYDATDYFTIAPEYGTRDDLAALASALHDRDMHLVLDGVFNHMGSSSPWFKDALSDPNSPYRDWFYISDQYKAGYRAWYNSPNLPELHLENRQLQARLFGDPDSVVQSYLRDGADGWRLDVAPDLGFKILSKLTAAAHTAKPGSLVIGENWLYPEEWIPAMDAVMNFHFREFILALAQGRLAGGHAGRMLERVVDDTGLEPLLKCWIILDNHDLPRLKTELPQRAERHLAQVLQFTLPGAPCVYYGVELGMEGGGDPRQRGPMRWDLVTDDNKELQWTRKLVAMRRANRALSIGEFRLLDSERLFAFMRRTDRVAETTVVVVNPTAEPMCEIVPVRDSKIMNWEFLRDELSGRKVRSVCGTLEVTVPPRTALVLRPVIPDSDEKNPYKRIQ